MASGEDRKRVARKILLLPLLGWAVMVAGGYYPTRLLAGPEGLQAMLLAQGLVVVVVFATLMPAMHRMVGRPPVESFKFAMLAGVVRFVATVALLALIAWSGRIHTTAFLLWGAAAYVVMVMLEAVALARWSSFLESERRC